MAANDGNVIVELSRREMGGELDKFKMDGVIFFAFKAFSLYDESTISFFVLFLFWSRILS